MLINTARSLVWKSGRINFRQIGRIEEIFCDMTRRVKVLVTHHPFDLPENYSHTDLVGRAHHAMAQIARCNIDLLLAGHFHVSHAGGTAARYQIPGHSAIFVQAGTVSTRQRGEANSFNVIGIAPDRIGVERYACGLGSRAFHLASAHEFRCTEAGWK